MRKLVTVLFFAVMLLILGLLVASVTSCSPATTSVAQSVPTPMGDGSFHHPYNVGLNPNNGDSWAVRVPSGHAVWTLNWIYGPRGVNPYGNTVTLKVGDDILYKNMEYQITAINRKALTMKVAIYWIDCCASR
jgi:hypothetical protein